MALPLSAPAQETPKIVLDSNATVFSMLAAINHCGYNQELAQSDPVRAQIRGEVAKAVEGSADAKAARDAMCAFYRDHLQADDSATLAQYLSLALNMGDPPKFGLKGKEADLPPDAAYVLGFAPLLQRFYETAGLANIWYRHQPDYSALVERFHDPVSKVLLGTEIYLRMPVSGYLARQFEILVEPLAAPGQVNSRNYGADYYMVVSPEQGRLNLDSIRHTYLHYIVDPLVSKRASTMQRLQPLLGAVQTAPLEQSYKQDVALLVEESLIRAIEARRGPPAQEAARPRTAAEKKAAEKQAQSKEAEQARRKAVDAAMSQGLILTSYFYDNLVKFEGGEEGLREIFPDWLYMLDVQAELKRAQNVVFASTATPEVMTATPGRRSLLDTAEQRMGEGDYAGARRLAQQALDEHQGDPGRALFLMAQSATLGRDADSARIYFSRTLEVSRDPRIVAWSHIYLARMADLQNDRQTALAHYRAALAAGDSAPDTKAAAQRGLEQPYAPPRGANNVSP